MTLIADRSGKIQVRNVTGKTLGFLDDLAPTHLLLWIASGEDGRVIVVT